MDLIEELKKEQKTERPPRRVGTSAYLTVQQEERLELLAQRSGKSRSKVLGRLIDLAFEGPTKNGAA